MNVYVISFFPLLFFFFKGNGLVLLCLRLLPVNNQLLNADGSLPGRETLPSKSAAGKPTC